MKLTLTLTEEQTQRVMNIIAKQPLEEVFDIALEIKAQTDEQFAEVERQVSKEQSEFYRWKKEEEYQKEKAEQELEQQGFTDLTK